MAGPVSIKQTSFILFALGLLILTQCSGSENNGFNLKDALIPVDEIYHGGPAKDGIPAIDNPRFQHADEAVNLRSEMRVLGIRRNGVSKAYPVSILNWHEIVNDRIGGEPVVITYCPLCGSGVAYSARTGGSVLHFGVSGLLYNSDVLLYDRETESLWSQLKHQAVSGKKKGTRLKMLTLEHTTWGRWLELHPETLVLSEDTGYLRSYGVDPYAGYENDKGLYFPVFNPDPRYHPKARIIGLEVDGAWKAYPFSELDKAGGRITDHFAGSDYIISYDRQSRSAWVEDHQGGQVPAVSTFWFAWTAFHPQSHVYVSSPETER
ncbi:MAG: hypothetical protein DIZ77_10350 [endosymbiont of Seepiophila jonesi]|uniref:DUF3179 domain-containing protein n=1 Tax=endosymbiont of Lamellibrachia luymesi TaxID=2200907 RepID=A0A370DYH5_9GAMM|nr:MAG: hypothetical protein DIZ79_09440 [endosymbiont of Lamellibrachia luymesi]RDH91689.1 MAG: hypothetical protein DIZ77_10350 [endosymbiont of Seepiophila jonesi]